VHSSAQKQLPVIEASLLFIEKAALSAAFFYGSAPPFVSPCQVLQSIFGSHSQKHEIIYIFTDGFAQLGQAFSEARTCAYTRGQVSRLAVSCPGSKEAMNKPQSETATVARRLLHDACCTTPVARRL